MILVVRFTEHVELEIVTLEQFKNPIKHLFTNPEKRQFNHGEYVIVKEIELVKDLNCSAIHLCNKKVLPGVPNKIIEILKYQC